MSSWHALSPTDVVSRLELDSQVINPEQPADARGLDADQVARRRERYGSNSLATAEPPSALRVLARQFKGPMIAFLAVCAVITAVEREWVDTVAIVVILLLNAVAGFWQERKAERDVRALQSLTTTQARVVRAGVTEEIDASELVPGDIVRLESGDRVPADLRLVAVSGLRVDESMLTGEVLPADKQIDAVDEGASTGDQQSLAFSGTLVVSGRGSGVVVATGSDTQIGHINDLVQGPVGKTPLQHLSERLERIIGGVVLGVAILIGIAGLFLGNSVSEMFRTGVALIVSALPEALPVVLTVAMGYGVSQMARRRAVVRRLSSVETLGSTTVIGSDKTGTLTQNRLTVELVWTDAGEQSVDPDAAPVELSESARRAILAGAATNEARRNDDGWIGDAVDVAMASLAERTGVLNDSVPNEKDGSQQAALGSIVADQPYEPDLGYSQTVRELDGRRVLFVKGAPERVLGFSSSLATDAGSTSLGTAARERVLAANEQMATDGLRVIATASRDLDPADDPEALVSEQPSDLVLLGLQGMVDPPRPGVPEAVQQCRDAGIRVMMITGDHPVTARAIGARLGLDLSRPPITGAQMADWDDDELGDRLEHASIAARMSPQDKLRIVELLQQRGDTVAVTGDGVNDAPALRAASIGVAMGESGTDVAREAADVVLTDDNFVTIVDAVEQGRVTFAAIRKATYFLLSSALATMLAVAVNTFTHHPLIFLPVMLLWMNIVMNGVQDVAMAFEPGEGDELEQKPRSRNEGILNATMWMRTLGTGVLMAVLTLVVYDRALAAGYGLDHARTLALTTMVMANFFQILNARTERRSVFTINHLRNPFLIIASVLALLIQWGAMSWGPSASVLGLAPLDAKEWLLAAGLGALVLLSVEIDKLIRRRWAAAHPRRESA